MLLDTLLTTTVVSLLLLPNQVTCMRLCSYTPTLSFVNAHPAPLSNKTCPSIIQLVCCTSYTAFYTAQLCTSLNMVTVPTPPPTPNPSPSEHKAKPQYCTQPCQPTARPSSVRGPTPTEKPPSLHLNYYPIVLYRALRPLPVPRLHHRPATLIRHHPSATGTYSKP